MRYRIELKLLWYIFHHKVSLTVELIMSVFMNTLSTPAFLSRPHPLLAAQTFSTSLENLAMHPSN